MALIQMNILSKKLMRTVSVNVILPVDKMIFPGMKAREAKPYKTLYLLHGIFGNYTDWITGTRLARWAEERDLVVVMPSGDNSFYVDHPNGENNYGAFIGQELVELTRAMFPLSCKREDTFIAGLSMGGYGAIRNGLKYNETFGSLAGLSSALVLESALEFENGGAFILNNRDYFESCFGDLHQALSNDMNPKMLINELAEKLKADPLTLLPNIYLACGTEDELLIPNQDLHQHMINRGIDHTYVEGPGGHTWEFWDRYIEKVLDWLPLEESSLGVNSGNIIS